MFTAKPVVSWLQNDDILVTFQCVSTDPAVTVELTLQGKHTNDILQTLKSQLTRLNSLETAVKSGSIGSLTIGTTYTLDQLQAL